MVQSLPDKRRSDHVRMMDRSTTTAATLFRWRQQRNIHFERQIQTQSSIFSISLVPIGIVEPIMSKLEIGDIIALQRTCKAPIYQELIKSQWNIDMQLKTFFRDPIAFRSSLGACNGLVCGRLVNKFFGRLPYLWLDAVYHI